MFQTCRFSAQRKNQIATHAQCEQSADILPVLLQGKLLGMSVALHTAMNSMHVKFNINPFHILQTK